ncbi:Allophanate hydrolase subunit 2 [Burkholderia dolosa AU0158]|nr:Allophanate hydrolase subunit 2 [Burkholderia dolosa AU0158]
MPESTRHEPEPRTVQHRGVAGGPAVDRAGSRPPRRAASRRRARRRARRARARGRQPACRQSPRRGCRRDHVRSGHVSLHARDPHRDHRHRVRTGTLDGKTVYSWWRLPVEAGQTLVLPAAKRGMRGYLCIAGGIDVLPMLGSRSTDLASRFGGLGERALRDGDRLPVGVPPTGAGCLAPGADEFGVKAPAWCTFVRVDEPPRRHRPAHAPWAMPVRVLPGPEYASFAAESQQAFWDEEWLVTANSNRMGYRLSGTELVRERPTELLSHAVLPGTIQVPPNGQPIVLMHDAQTTGGYPKIGTVIRADLWKLAQARLNLPIRFVRTTLDAARAALSAERAYLRQIDVAIEMRDEARRRDRSRAA